MALFVAVLEESVGHVSYLDEAADRFVSLVAAPENQVVVPEDLRPVVGPAMPVVEMFPGTGVVQGLGME